ncbi:unnamed protein product [Lactuca saligna]|uniref:Uncharacterized protein n=1 Tax=Lactuca saligna TaxID=75948 RepID=A0AA35UWN5_LACSI|nr:unnamed protein product [Lactuca saligna]
MSSASLTYASTLGGSLSRSTTPEPQIVATLHHHHMLLSSGFVRACFIDSLPRYHKYKLFRYSGQRHNCLPSHRCGRSSFSLLPSPLLPPPSSALDLLSPCQRPFLPSHRRHPELVWPGLFGHKVSRVLGGGLVPGSLILISGDPCVGKRTLMLPIATIIAEGREIGKPAPVLYVSGEESVEQIGNRADRMEIDIEELFLYSSTDIELTGVTGSAGGIYQVKECTTALLRFAKNTNTPGYSHMMTLHFQNLY